MESWWPQPTEEKRTERKSDECAHFVRIEKKEARNITKLNAKCSEQNNECFWFVWKSLAIVVNLYAPLYILFYRKTFSLRKHGATTHR